MSAMHHKFREKKVDKAAYYMDRIWQCGGTTRSLITIIHLVCSACHSVITHMCAVGIFFFSFYRLSTSRCVYNIFSHFLLN